MGATEGSVGVTSIEFQNSLWNSMQSPYLSNLLNAIYECDAYVCQFMLPAAGFSVDCLSSYEPIDYGLQAPEALAQNRTSGYQNLPLFSMQWSFAGSKDNVTSAAIFLNLTYAVAAGYDDPDSPVNNVQGGSCAMNLTTTICEFRPAVLQYPVIVTNQDSATFGAKKDDIKAIVQQQDKQDDSSSSSLSSIQTFNRFATINSTNLTTTADDSWYGSYAESWHQLAGVKVLSNTDVIEPFVPYANSTLYGFYLAFKDIFTASASMSWDGKDWSLVENGSFAFASDTSYDLPPEGYCNYTYADNKDLVLQQINLFALDVATDPYNYYVNNENVSDNSTNQLERDLYYITYNNYTDFYTDLIASKKVSAQDLFEASYDIANPLPGFDPTRAGLQSTIIHKQYKDVFFVTHWEFTWGAIAATIVVILCIVPVYWRFWDLGRKVTLGPFEIAHAFQSPAFAGAQSTVGETDLVLKQIGRNRVKYVEVTDETGRKYAFQPV